MFWGLASEAPPFSLAISCRRRLLYKLPFSKTVFFLILSKLFNNFTTSYECISLKFSLIMLHYSKPATVKKESFYRHLIKNNFSSFLVFTIYWTNTTFYLHSMGRKNSSVNNELKQYLTCNAIVLYLDHMQKLYCPHCCGQ